MATNDKSQTNGKAVTDATKTEATLRDIMRQAKRNKKVIETLVEMKSKNPAIAQAVAAVKDEQVKLKSVAAALVAKELDNI